MRVLAVLGVLLLVLVLGAAAYAYFGFYNIAASDPHVDVVRWSLERAQDNSVERHAREEVGEVPALDTPEMIRTGADHYRQEGCIQCHAGPGIAQAEFARHMRPEPPDLTEAVTQWNDAELFWMVQHGIRMTGMPAFGPTHREHELWAMVAFIRQLPEMSESSFRSSPSRVSEPVTTPRATASRGTPGRPSPEEAGASDWLNRPTARGTM